MLNVLVNEDPEPYFHQKVRASLTPDGHVIIDEILHAEMVLERLNRATPELVILGPHLEERIVFALGRDITQCLPNTKTILFTAHGNDVLFQVDAVHAGIAACLSRNTTDSELADSITQVLAGHQLFPREILVLGFQSITLTTREQEVLKLLADRKTDSEIALLLSLKVSTVHNHTQRILDRLGVHDRDAAVRRAHRRNLV